MLKANKGKCEIRGKGVTVLAEFSTLTKALVKSGASKEDLEQAFKIGTGEIDVMEVLAERMKELIGSIDLEKIKNELKEENTDNN